MKLLTLVKFSPRGQVFAYMAEDLTLARGDSVLADTGQGVALGEIVGVAPHGDGFFPDGMASIDHRATPEELLKDAGNREQTDRAFEFCVSRIRAKGLDMKLVNVEALFDLSKILFYFTAPTRIDFRELVKDLVREFHTRIELRQIGVRHETQMLGAVGACGMVCCCRRYMREFAPVTIKMAKEQNLFLNPSKISGICGRLLCCLSFEQENYESFHRACPRFGKRYNTENGLMKVLRANMFRNSVSAVDESGDEHEYTLEEWAALKPTRPEGTARPDDGSVQQPRNGHQSMDMLVVEADPDMDDEDLDRSLDSAFSALEEFGSAPMPAAEPVSRSSSHSRHKHKPSHKPRPEGRKA